MLKKVDLRNLSLLTQLLWIAFLTPQISLLKRQKKGVIFYKVSSLEQLLSYYYLIKPRQKDYFFQKFFLENLYM